MMKQLILIKLVLTITKTIIYETTFTPRYNNVHELPLDLIPFVDPMKETFIITVKENMKLLVSYIEEKIRAFESLIILSQYSAIKRALPFYYERGVPYRSRSIFLDGHKLYNILRMEQEIVHEVDKIKGEIGTLFRKEIKRYLTNKELVYNVHDQSAVVFKENEKFKYLTTTIETTYIH